MAIRRRKNMNVFDRLYSLFDMYEGFTYDYLLRLAAEKAEYIFKSVRSRDGSASAENFMVTYCALLACSDFTVSQREYDFFVTATKINKYSFDSFKQLASKVSGDYDVKMMYREYGKESYMASSFDEAMMIFALTLCACDGRISDAEKRYITDFVPLPGICD